MHQEQQSALKIPPLSEVDTARLLSFESEAEVDRLADELQRSHLDLRLLWLRGRNLEYAALCIECKILKSAEGSARCYDCGAALRRRFNGHGFRAGE